MASSIARYGGRSALWHTNTSATRTLAASRTTQGLQKAAGSKLVSQTTLAASYTFLHRGQRYHLVASACTYFYAGLCPFSASLIHAWPTILLRVVQIEIRPLYAPLFHLSSLDRHHNHGCTLTHPVDVLVHVFLPHSDQQQWNQTRSYFTSRSLLNTEEKKEETKQEETQHEPKREENSWAPKGALVQPEWPPFGRWPYAWIGLTIASLFMFGYTWFIMREEKMIDRYEFIKWGGDLDRIHSLKKIRKYLIFDSTSFSVRPYQPWIGLLASFGEMVWCVDDSTNVLRC